MAASEDLQEPDGIARACNNLGVLYETQGDHDRAIGWYVKAADTLHAVGEHHREVTVLINLSSLYEAMWAQDQAAHYFDRAWEIADQCDYLDHLATLCALRGNTAFQIHETYVDGYRWYARARVYAAQHDDQALSTTIDRIEAYLARMLEQGRQVEAARFRQVLADTNIEESAPLQNPKLAERWCRVVMDSDAAGK
jgi:tetratricopeptide (TPR) repeat protein